MRTNRLSTVVADKHADFATGPLRYQWTRTRYEILHGQPDGPSAKSYRLRPLPFCPEKFV